MIKEATDAGYSSSDVKFVGRVCPQTAGRHGPAVESLGFEGGQHI